MSFVCLGICVSVIPVSYCVYLKRKCKRLASAIDMYSAQTASHVSEIERLRSLRLPDTQEVCAYLDDRLGEIAGQYESGGFRPYMVFKFEGMLAVMEGLSFIERYTADDYRRKCDSITEDSFKKLTGGGY